MEVTLPGKINSHSGMPYVEAAIKAAAMAGLNCSELSQSQRDLMNTVRDELVSGLVTNYLILLALHNKRSVFTITQSMF